MPHVYTIQIYIVFVIYIKSSPNADAEEMQFARDQFRRYLSIYCIYL